MRATAQEPRFLPPFDIEPPSRIACVVPGTLGVTTSLALSLAPGQPPFVHVEGTVLRATIPISDGETDAMVDVEAGGVRLRGYARVAVFANESVMLGGTWVPGAGDGLFIRAAAPDRLGVDGGSGGMVGKATSSLELWHDLAEDWIDCSRVRMGRGGFSVVAPGDSAEVSGSVVLTTLAGTAFARMTTDDVNHVTIVATRGKKTQIAASMGDGFLVGWVQSDRVVRDGKQWGHMFGGTDAYCGGSDSLSLGLDDRESTLVCPYDLALHANDEVAHRVVGIAEAGTVLRLIEGEADGWSTVAAQPKASSCASVSGRFAVRAADVAECRATAARVE
jgi:hypothetical protein